MTVLHPANSPPRAAVLAGPALVPEEPRKSLRLASFNIQSGIHTSNFGHYVTKSWQHLLPTYTRFTNLDRIAGLLRPFDIVGLQEVDGGGVRSAFVGQTEYLAYRAGFDYWHHQINRRIANLALHSNGLLSRLRPEIIHEHRLPGLPGRGALLARFGNGGDSLYLCILHLALGRRARLRQVRFIAELLCGLPYVVLMGDLNCEPHSPEMRVLMEHAQLCNPGRSVNTFPSWRPQRRLDHILVTPNLEVENVRVLNFPCSDHLPVALEVYLPGGFSAGARSARQ